LWIFRFLRSSRNGIKTKAKTQPCTSQNTTPTIMTKIVATEEVEKTSSRAKSASPSLTGMKGV
jgi:hypothetical protein